MKVLEILRKILEFLGGNLIKAFLDRRRIRVLVHRAFFLNNPEEYFFINVTNLSRDRAIEITHIWFQSHPEVHVLNPNRPLPKRLEPDETWETWIRVNDLPANYRDDAFTLARVRMSTGSVAYSQRNINVPPVGAVPGGPINYT